MTAKNDISKCLSLLFGKLKLCIFLSFIVLCLLQPTANYDLAIIEDYLPGNAKIKISIKKQNGVVVIFSEPWQLLLTGSAVPRIYFATLVMFYVVNFSQILMLNRSFFPNFGQGPFPKIAGKGPGKVSRLCFQFFIR